MKIIFLSTAEVSIVRITNALHPHRLTICRTRASLVDHIGDCEILIVQNNGFPYHVVDAEVLQHAKRLKLIQHYGVSHDGTDIDAARTQGIRIATTSGANSQSVAELGIYLL